MSAITLTASSAGQSAAADAPEFNRDVRPILAEHCFACHGPDAADRAAGLRLDQATGEEGAYRERGGSAAIAPGSLEDSEVWYRLVTEFEDERMPPPEAHDEGLDEEEREIVRRWIEAGAPYEEHWAFAPPRRRPLPDAPKGAWGAGAIDRHVLAHLAAEGLDPSPRADRRTLLRRLFLDLTGLPPTRAEIRAFLEDGREDAYERLVDDLLARPAHGEHAARYWLDLVRFADTNGVHHDHFRDHSPYRDWVIRAMNEGMGYDEFVTAQVAGDLLPGATVDDRTASGFLRLHMIIDRGTMLPEESLSRNVIDRVSAVGTAFMGLTLQCAVCHDHKYDPIRQKDFFQLYAFLNNLDGAPETGGRSGADFARGVQPPYMRFPTDEQTARLAALDLELDATRAAQKALETAAAAKEEIDGARAEVRRLGRERGRVEGGVRAVMVMKERAEPRPAHVFVRGAYDQLGEEVQRDTPAFLPPLDRVAEGGPATRLDLARWLVAPENPLTARVAANRVWQELFGVGLVKTSEDFGTRGEWPRHLALLDHLALDLRESGWDMKALRRQIVLSETYRQASVAAPEAFERDPDNRLLARGSRYRLDAEVIRDQVLASSGLLSAEMYGPSVKPPQPAGVWKAVTLPDSYPRVFEADEGEATRRRSVYTFWKRGMPPPQMTILDAPNRESCVARRERTNTPLQALLLMNEEEYLRAARHLAAAEISIEGDDEARLERIYEAITGRLPEARVSGALLSALADLRELYGANAGLAEELCGEAASGADAAELAAWTMATSAIQNLDTTRTRD